MTSYAITIGFLQDTLEPHLREFELSAFAVGCFFVLQGGFYAVSAPIFGLICDRVSKKGPFIITVAGASFIMITFVLMGPLPILPFGKNLPLIGGSLVFTGIGVGAEVVAGYSEAHAQAVRGGLPDNKITYGIISGLWGSSFALGAFIGPTAAGFLYDAVGFGWGALFVVAVQAVAILAVLTLEMYKYRNPYEYETLGEQEDDENKSIIANEHNVSYDSLNTTNVSNANE